jgi:F0F1-type ATP synthase membrane subunit b/b'
MTGSGARNLVFLVAAFAASALCPSVAAAAEQGGGGKWGVLLIIGRTFNLAIVVGLLVWVARKPLANFYASRSQSIRDQLDEALKSKAEAEARLADMEARMSRVDQELAEIKKTGEREARAEYERLLVEAQSDADRIVARARQDIESLTRAAQIELKDYAADLAIRSAEEQIRREISDEDRGRLFTAFLNKVGGSR